MTGRTRIYNYEPLAARDPQHGDLDQQLLTHVSNVVVALARIEDEIAAAAFLTTDPHRRHLVHWVSVQGIPASMRHVDGYAVVDPRAIACAWGWEP